MVLLHHDLIGIGAALLFLTLAPGIGLSQHACVGIFIALTELPGVLLDDLCSLPLVVVGRLAKLGAVVEAKDVG